MKCIKGGNKAHMTCVLTNTKTPTFVISLECIKCIEHGHPIK